MHIMAQETLDENESVIEEYDHGGRVVKVGNWNATYRYDEPNPSGGYVSHEYDSERRATAHGILHAVADYRSGDTQIPLSVVCEGKKAVATYLYTESGLSPAYIANKMGLAEQTVQQYITDFLKGR